MPQLLLLQTRHLQLDFNYTQFGRLLSLHPCVPLKAVTLHRFFLLSFLGPFITLQVNLIFNSLSPYQVPELSSSLYRWSRSPWHHYSDQCYHLIKTKVLKLKYKLQFQKFDNKTISPLFLLLSAATIALRLGQRKFHHCMALAFMPESIL